ncbi:unnamed protein product [Adineta ricciae]|uniref:Uncharacterized protein n=1 Tax=Adineta ricciae TaxID=249248 RepID=A0A816GC17_ADIRI|nr:unnamed protein product [Adineta ricciae]
MQPSTSLSSIASSNSSIYGSRTILDEEDLPSAAPRCRSSIISSLDNHQTNHSSDRSITKCRHLFRTCLSSTSSSLSALIQKKLADQTFRKQYFAKLCRHHRLLLVLNDYHCQCGCQFRMKQGTFVLLYETESNHRQNFVTVISNQLVCSKVPPQFLCDLDTLRERVRCRASCHNEQSFDL